MAEGGQIDKDAMKCQPSVKIGSVYQNPWGDGKIPSFLDARYFLWEKNESNVPSNEVLLDFSHKWQFSIIILKCTEILTASIELVDFMKYCILQIVCIVNNMVSYNIMQFLHKFSLISDHQDELKKNLPVIKLSLDELNLPETGIRITWLGHASVLAQFDNFNILADPIFSDRCSPLGFLGPKRYRPAPYNVSELPKIDAVCISHNHYDHLDVQTVKDLSDFHENLHWFVPIGLKQWFVFTPTKHWCNRGLLDRNKVLWGSWTVLGPRYRYYFAGDTGYCDAFKQIGERFGPIDVAAIPIGAYEPR